MDDAELATRLNRLYDLLNTDPQAAADEARAIPDFIMADGLPSRALRAASLVDAAAITRDKVAAQEAQSILEQLHAEFPDRLEIAYNLANALSLAARLVPYDGPSWHLTTSGARRRARAIYTEGAENADGELLGRIHTNLGNELWRAYRWVEAYDAYMHALGVDPTNAIASTGAVKVLLRAVARGIGEPRTCEMAAARHLRDANLSRDRCLALGGGAAVSELDRLLSLSLVPGEPPDLTSAGPYERFVAENRLALAATIEGLPLDIRRWDSLTIASITEPPGAAFGVPPAFSVFNAAKSEYLAARWLYHQALAGEIADTGSYHDSLDYAVYGMQPALLVFAQRAGLDVLDKVALLVTEYFGICESPRGISFRQRWHRPSGSRKAALNWHPALALEIERGNEALIALADIAIDLGPHGRLKEKLDLRDAGTHRALVMHDLSLHGYRKSRYVEHVSQDDFQCAVLETIRLARASLIYAVEAIAIHESRTAEGPGFVAQLFVPSHDWVRGQDD